MIFPGSGKNKKYLKPPPSIAMSASHYYRAEAPVQSTFEQSVNKWAEKKKGQILSMKYWLFNRDPYFMVYGITPI